MNRRIPFAFGLAAVLGVSAASAQTPPASNASSTKPATPAATHAPAPAATTPKATTAKPAPPKATFTTEEITQAQQGLAKAGFYKEKPTGKLDHHTTEAIKAYQKANKLPVNGKLSEELLTKLKS